jgi:hypothetical protein
VGLHIYILILYLVWYIPNSTIDSESSTSIHNSKMSDRQTGTTLLTDTTKETFHIRREKCLNTADLNVHDSTPESSGARLLSGSIAIIRDDEKTFFSDLLCTTKINIHDDEKNDESNSLKVASLLESAIAVLVQTLQPCFDTNTTFTTRYFALSCWVVRNRNYADTICR